jgi:DNA (cytosine-5)-methyltransferase 1
MFTGIGGFTLGINQAYETKDRRMAYKAGQVHTVPERHQKEHSARVGHTPPRGDVHEPDQSAPTCIGYSEIDKYASSIYSKHYPDHKNYGDITKIIAKDLPDFDLLVGGFPCQSFSIAGKRRGFSDTRGTMFFELARILRAKQPRLFVFENVKGLLSHDNGNTFKTIVATLDELGYDLQWQVLNSKDFGVPQSRERVFIIGHTRGTRRPEVFPITEGTGGSIDSCQPLGTLTARYPAAQREGAYPEETRNGERKIRKLTPLECERIQGFPDRWTDGISDTQRYKCLGNAVTVNVVSYIFTKILT